MVSLVVHSDDKCIDEITFVLLMTIFINRKNKFFLSFIISFSYINVCVREKTLGFWGLEPTPNRSGQFFQLGSRPLGQLILIYVNLLGFIFSLIRGFFRGNILRP